MRFAICDDDHNFCIQLHTYVQDFFVTHKITCPEILIFHSGEEILQYKKNLDFIFIDVEMSGISGIHAGKELITKNPHSLYIVITAYEDYLDEALHFHAFRYLSKPLDKQRLYRNLLDALKTHNIRNTKVGIITKNSVHTVYANDIIMIEAEGKKINVYTINGIYHSTQNLEYWHQTLNRQCFFRSHRSYIVNMNHINNFDKSIIYLYNNQYRAYLTVRKYTSFKHEYMLFLECH